MTMLINKEAGKKEWEIGETKLKYWDTEINKR